MKSHIVMGSLAWNDVVGSKANGHIRNSQTAVNKAVDDFNSLVKEVKPILEIRYEYKSNSEHLLACKINKSIFVHGSKVSVINNG